MTNRSHTSRTPFRYRHCHCCRSMLSCTHSVSLSEHMFHRHHLSYTLSSQLSYMCMYHRCLLSKNMSYLSQPHNLYTMPHTPSQQPYTSYSLASYYSSHSLYVLSHCLHSLSNHSVSQYSNHGMCIHFLSVSQPWLSMSMHYCHCTTQSHTSHISFHLSHYHYNYAMLSCMCSQTIGHTMLCCWSCSMFWHWPMPMYNIVSHQSGHHNIR